MPTDARVVVVPEKLGERLTVEDVRIPDPGPYEVVVKQFASGVCHSQLHQMHRPRTAPVILGHESTGVVVAAGREVKHVKEGDDVMVTWVPRDGEHATRRANMVDLQLENGTKTAPTGCFTWANVTIADEQYVVKTPGNHRKDVTAIIGCAVMTGAGAVYYTAGVKKYESVAILGVGGVGLSAITAAMVVEANPVIAVDLDDEKLEFAKKFGATHGVNAGRVDPIEAIREITRKTHIGGAETFGADFAIDCIGVRKTMEQILPAARNGVLGMRTGGTAVLVGVPTTDVTLDPRDLLINEKKYIGSIGGSCRPDRDFPMFLRWYAEGELDLDALVTKRFKIDEINEACHALESGQIAGRAILEF
jgi:Zn-dependent alcohol dehydrogenase